MANTVIVSPSLTTTGDDSGNLFVFQSGALSGSTLIGGSGKDTVDLLSGESAASDVSIDLKGGQDSIAITAVAFGSSTIRGGAGADTIDVRSAGTTVLNSVYGGDGNDLLILSGLADIQNVFMGGGSDFISGSVAVSASGSEILLGAGADTVSMTAATFASSTVLGGGGADSIAIDLNGAATAVKIHGDAAGVVGADTIRLTLSAGQVFDETNIQGAGGADLIHADAGTFQGTGKILGNFGGDTIDLSAGVFLNAGGLTIGGGAGSDTIMLDEFGSAGSGAVVIGGGGADSITLLVNAAGAGSAGAAGFTAGNGYGTIIGGAGADSIFFSGAALDGNSAGIAAVIGFSSLSDSTESQMDIVTFSAGSAGEANNGFLLNLAIASGRANNATNAADGGKTLSAGVLQSAGASNTTLTQVVSAVDSLASQTGQAAAFAHSGNAYIFVQGGSTDLVAQFDSQRTYTAGADVTFSSIGSGDFKIGLLA